MAGKEKKPGVLLIATERARQVRTEGFDAHHDREHENRELVFAGLAYAAYPEIVYRKEPTDRGLIFEDVWPYAWSEEWDKRKGKTMVRRLAIAGALIAAEIDRVQAKPEGDVEEMFYVPVPDGIRSAGEFFERWVEPRLPDSEKAAALAALVEVSHLTSLEAFRQAIDLACTTAEARGFPSLVDQLRKLEVGRG